MPEIRNAAIRRFLEEQRARQMDFLAELVQVPSDNPPGDTARHGLRAAQLLEGLGLEVERHPISGRECRANGMISATNLVVRRRFGNGPTVALNAHGDVVAPGEGWTTDPYGAEVRDGVMYGRGVAVSKSDFATYTFALLALEAAEALASGTVELHFTYDEEAGGAIGPKWLLDKGLSKPDFALSAGFSYSVVTAHDGCLHLEVEVSGKSAHAARPEGIVPAAPFFQRNINERVQNSVLRLTIDHRRVRRVDLGVEAVTPRGSKPIGAGDAGDVAGAARPSKRAVVDRLPGSTGRRRRVDDVGIALDHGEIVHAPAWNGRADTAPRQVGEDRRVQDFVGTRAGNRLGLECGHEDSTEEKGCHSKNGDETRVSVSSNPREAT